MAGPKLISSASLPPGCRFYPSEEQLLRYYLTNKNRNDKTFAKGGDLQGRGEGEAGFCCYDLIRELDLYHYDPFELPEVSRFSYGYGGDKRHWYCYTALSAISGTENDARKILRRKVKSGYWRRKGRIRNVFGNSGKPLLGTRTTFVFYLRNSNKNTSSTDWVLYEYALLGHLKDSFVICRVFIKSYQRNNISENGLSSCAEESISAVRHIGIQHDGIATPNIDDVKAKDDNSIDRTDTMSANVTSYINNRNENHVKTTRSPASKFAVTIQSYPQPQLPFHLGQNLGFSTRITAGALWFDIPLQIFPVLLVALFLVFCTMSLKIEVKYIHAR